MVSWLGFGLAKVTSVGPDSGIDVSSNLAVAQVKMEGVPTGRPAVQRLLGVSVGEKKQGIFFSLSGYTAGANQWATQVGILLFQFDYQGGPRPCNKPAHDCVIQRGGRGTNSR